MGIRGQSLGAVHHYVATVYILVEDQDWTSKLTAESCDAVVSDMSPQRHTTATRTHSGRSAPVAAAGHSPGAYTCWKRSICACTWILRCGRDGYIRMPMHRCLGTVVVCATRIVLRRRTWWDESVVASDMVAGEAGSRMSSSRVAQPLRPITCLLRVVAGIETTQATNRKAAAGGIT